MPSQEYPQDPRDALHDDESDEDNSDEEEEEEEIEEWDEVLPLDEIDEMENGPCTFFVGGFSTCSDLEAAVNRAIYKEDMVLVMPGRYLNAPTDGTKPELILDEEKLGGLRIYGLEYALSTAAEARKASLRKLLRPPQGARRVGPWFTYYTAAVAELGEQQGALPPSSFNATSTSASFVFGDAITQTAVDAAQYPLLDFDVVIGFDKEKSRNTQKLRTYVQETPSDDEDEDEEGEEDGGASGKKDRGGDGESEDGSETKSTADPAKDRAERAVKLGGLCLLRGATVEPLVRAHITNCVLGNPVVTPALESSIATLTCHPLSEALIEHCIIFGAARYACYAYPRAAVTLRDCILEGPHASLRMAGMMDRVRSQLPTAKGRGAVGPSVSIFEYLEQQAAKQARLASRADATAEGGEEALSTSVHSDLLPSFVVPTTTSCEAAVFCDDADLVIEDCMMANTRLGLLLHDRCSRTRIRGVDIRGVGEAGIYVYGVGGAASVQNSVVSSCGREGVIIVGPSAVELQKAVEAQAAAVPAAEEEEDEEEEANNAPPAVNESHPEIRRCVVIGGVRLQGAVRTGAMMDNIVYAPKSSATSESVFRTENLCIPATCERAFHYAGVEGAPRVLEEVASD